MPSSNYISVENLTQSGNVRPDFSSATHTKDVPVPGRRCPACLEKGETVWVIPGKDCP
ncbi:hypothetical protein AOQ84DRAFT_354202 [Glonium stellatum]|uniref:Uncharacterized protein n=1 Tax=Glonium stellatum TaxID=574774 RepID=A0A8E2F1S5_9PEZI|nr:hypothetical protein AOQ84DRAFT_354202 [Glonium stellatum]